jgi:glycosyltransferase involved in cell wall biosynthesis
MREHGHQLSVVIPVYNGASTIGSCLEALNASLFRDFEVVVVDDASADDTVSVVSQFACTCLRQTVNQGAGAARNLGACSAKGGILFFLDADIQVEPDSLGLLVDAFRDRPGVDMIFGSFFPESIPKNFFSLYKNALHHHTHQTSSEEAVTFCGGFGAIRREAFLASGGFDPQYRYLEDVEFGLRMHVAGHRIWLYKDLQFHHSKHYNLRGLVRSDLYQRAIPWTRLILTTGIVRNDLSTKTANVLSVPVSYLLLLTLPILLSASRWPLWCLLLFLFLYLNRNFFSFVNRQHGFQFLCCSVATCWFGYLYSGVGVVSGIASHVIEGARRTPDEFEAVE